MNKYLENLETGLDYIVLITYPLFFYYVILERRSTFLIFAVGLLTYFFSWAMIYNIKARKKVGNPMELLK